MLKIKALERLVHELSRLPGVGPKSAQRMAYHILRSEDGFGDRLTEAVGQVKEQVHLCPSCYNYTDAENGGDCHYCADLSRRPEVVCVVEQPSDIMSIESSGAFRGRYHVLHGAIAPLDGIQPENLKIAELIDRIKAEGSEISEVILALDADLEGDTTVLYLTDLLKQHGVSVSRIAHGVPIGGNIDYIDDRTMGRALENRVEL